MMAPTIDGTYEAFAPYWAMSLGVRPEAIRGQFEYHRRKRISQGQERRSERFLRQFFCRWR